MLHGRRYNPVAVLSRGGHFRPHSQACVMWCVQNSVCTMCILRACVQSIFSVAPLSSVLSSKASSWHCGQVLIYIFSIPRTRTHVFRGVVMYTVVMACGGSGCCGAAAIGSGRFGPPFCFLYIVFVAPDKLSAGGMKPQ